jgi:hypothetical protein
MDGMDLPLNALLREQILTAWQENLGKRCVMRTQKAGMVATTSRRRWLILAIHGQEQAKFVLWHSTAGRATLDILAGNDKGFRFE